MDGFLNYSKPSNYMVQFSEADEIYKYYLQGVKLPDIQTGLSTNYYDGELVYTPGQSKDNGLVTLNFILDEDLKVYTNLLDMQMKSILESYTIDVMEVIIQNNQNVPILNMKYFDCFFTYVEGPNLETTTDESESKITAQMNFNGFEYKNIND